jgi:hypothetical protein
MKPLPTLTQIDAEVSKLHPDTVLICDLIKLRQTRPLTPAEQSQYDDAWERTDKRVAQALASDLIHDEATESHSYPTRLSRHDD